jgi:hypothetical protein
MEVHAHSHTARKKWTHYFWEFLMLFLAVSLGFLVENQREHYVEHKRAIVFAQSMLEDLKKDTAALHSGIDFSVKKINAADSTVAMLHKFPVIPNILNFYKDLTLVITVYPFIPTKGTYEQMKASGSLRYFNQSLVNMMNAYDVQIVKTAYRDNLETGHQTDRITPLIIEVVNMESLVEIRLNKPVTGEMYLTFPGKAIINKFINLMAISKITRARSMMEYEEQLAIAEKIIEALKKEYHLE